MTIGLILWFRCFWLPALFWLLLLIAKLLRRDRVFHRATLAHIRGNFHAVLFQVPLSVFLPVIMAVGPSQRHLLDGKSVGVYPLAGRPSVAFQAKCHDFYGWFMSFPSKPLIRLVAVVSRCETTSCQAIPRAEVLAVAFALTSGATPAASHVHFISCKAAMETPLSRSAAAFPLTQTSTFGLPFQTLFVTYMF